MPALIMFYVLAAIVVAGAVLFAMTDRLIYALIYCLMAFTGLAGLYLLLDAPFVAMSQILIYAGAVVVLVLFVVMLTVGNRPVESKSGTKPYAAVLSAGFFVILLLALRSTNIEIAKEQVFQNTDYLAKQLFTTYRLPFELAGVLLLAAVIGAVYLAKEDGR